jgi:hypothetical protein
VARLLFVTSLKKTSPDFQEEEIVLQIMAAVIVEEVDLCLLNFNIPRVEQILISVTFNLGKNQSNYH